MLVCVIDVDTTVDTIKPLVETGVVTMFVGLLAAVLVTVVVAVLDNWEVVIVLLDVVDSGMHALFELMIP